MLAIGLMSGTSLDGIDVSLIKTNGQEEIQIVDNYYHEYPSELIKQIRQLILDESGSFGWFELEKRLTVLNAYAVNQILHRNRLKPDQVQVIGYHGQTIYHNPNKHVTWQIGDSNLLAKLTGVNVVGDFRRRDMAYGGQGAPLVPVYHRALASRHHSPLVILNIGGVANVTYVDAANDRLIAFDTGPGNALIDDVMHSIHFLQYDENGQTASRGNVNHELVGLFMEDEYFRKQPPKSLDRNHFKYLTQKLDYLNDNDKIATISYFTVASIVHAIKCHLSAVKTVFYCGGGGKNKFLIESLRSALQPHVSVVSIESLGYDPDFIESQAFAYLAVRHLKKLPSTFPTTTGTSKPVSCGAFFPFE